MKPTLQFPDHITILTPRSLDERDNGHTDVIVKLLPVETEAEADIAYGLSTEAGEGEGERYFFKFDPPEFRFASNEETYAYMIDSTSHLNIQLIEQNLPLSRIDSFDVIIRNSADSTSVTRYVVRTSRWEGHARNFQQAPINQSVTRR